MMVMHDVVIGDAMKLKGDVRKAAGVMAHAQTLSCIASLSAALTYSFDLAL